MGVISEDYREVRIFESLSASISFQNFARIVSTFKKTFKSKSPHHDSLSPSSSKQLMLILVMDGSAKLGEAMTNLPLDSAGNSQKFIQAIVAVLGVLCLIQING